MSGAINMSWLNSSEAESLIPYFYDDKSRTRRRYGLLERPSLPPSIEEVTYKIFMIGRPGVGKSSVVSRFSGIAHENYVSSEINGIRKTMVYWPVKIWDKVVLFRLNFWDTTESSIKKYSHVLPACKEKVDAICSIFSFEDPSSFNDIPYLMNSMSNIKERPANVVIGTRYKPWSTLPVTELQLKEFESKWKVKVIKVDVSKTTARPEILDCAYQLNSICKALWNRDQEFITKQIHVI
ncbi:Similar to cplane2: Ciliogenesis and planar polarity effector 2 (Xenopus laevis) [Cotesia congregata]|uniref:Ciliogenesis and planar polarity effector 2 n=1 Tax=Cotesia congregata TaxID=51543 RepID=A0A8J2HDD1_COTCN|nr:Similar to cplane2: Ciliogenesis and planar polarity effector 2 (Xenopus laevis) [Cotesia congregata]